MGNPADHTYQALEISPRSSLSSDASWESLDLTQEELLSSSKQDNHHGVPPRRRKSSSFGWQAVRLAIGSILLGSLLGLVAVLVASAGEVEFRARYGTWNSSDPSGELSIAQNRRLPKQPTPISIEIEQDQQNWTTWLPRDKSYPLEPEVYAKLCSDSDELAQHLATGAGGRNATHAHAHAHAHAHYPYYHRDERYTDVADAEARALLPPAPAADPRSTVPTSIPPASTDPRLPPCERSLTVVLASADPGLGATLMALWAAAGLAARERRAFFVDDRGWAYGRYADYFAPPPPPPGCRPPPDAHRVPCPRTAAHLLASAGTRGRIFGHAFAEQFEDPREAGTRRQRPIFALMRAGFEALGGLGAEDEEYVQRRVAGFVGRETVGVHVRHGDRHPWEYAFQESYIPLQRYLNATASNGTNQAPTTLAASDDPAVYAAPEMAPAHPAQDRYTLADPAFAAAGVDWTGGLTAAAFWHMGGSDDTQALTKQPPDAATMRLRRLVGRSFVLDLAVLSRADRVACAVSSASCRLLAVMMGWERAVEQQRWVNVDGDFDWTGIRW